MGVQCLAQHTPTEFLLRVHVSAQGIRRLFLQQGAVYAAAYLHAAGLQEGNRLTALLARANGAAHAKYRDHCQQYHIAQQQKPQ